MSGPNKKKSPYVLFTIDWKRRAESNGRTFENGLIQAFTDPECSTEWQSLSKHQKEYYKSRAGRQLCKTAIDTENEDAEQGKRACNGQLLSTLLQKERDKLNFVETMNEYINCTVTSAAQHNDLPQTHFIIIHANWFCGKLMNNNETDFLPAEFAVAEYSIENGIGNLYHEILNAKIPLGQGFEAQQRSQNYHKIPVECSEGEQDYRVMYQRMVDFLSPHMKDKKFPPLFASKCNMAAVRSLVNRMCDAADKPRDTILVYCLQNLFAVIYNTLIVSKGGHPIHWTTINYIIEKDIYCYSNGLACKFHEPLDGVTQYCSESIVRRLGFTISTFTCKFLDFEPTPGIHCPMRRKHGNVNSLENSMQNLSLHSSMVRRNAQIVQNHTMPSPNAQLPNQSGSHVALLPDLSPIIPPEIARPLRPPNTMSRAVAMLKTTD